MKFLTVSLLLAAVAVAIPAPDLPPSSSPPPPDNDNLPPGSGAPRFTTEGASPGTVRIPGRPGLDPLIVGVPSHNHGKDPIVPHTGTGGKAIDPIFPHGDGKPAIDPIFPHTGGNGGKAIDPIFPHAGGVPKPIRESPMFHWQGVCSNALDKSNLLPDGPDARDSDSYWAFLEACVAAIEGRDAGCKGKTYPELAFCMQGAVAGRQLAPTVNPPKPKST